MKYRDEKFYWTYQRGIGWPNDHIGQDSMTHWIIEKSVGFTDVGLLRILEILRPLRDQVLLEIRLVL